MSPPVTVVRPARMADADAMSRVMIASITELCRPDHGGNAAVIADWTANKAPRTVRAWLEDPDIVMLVAERDGTIAAVGAFRRDGEITLNYVAPEHRFAGVSRTLLQAMEARLADADVNEARLTSTATAHRFYRACGWQDDGGPVLALAVPSYPMRKRLTAG